MRIFFRMFSLITLILGLSLQTTSAGQEFIEASGSYIVDLKVDETFAQGTARAREEAKRAAVEQAGVYLQSHSKMINMRLVEDEVKTVAAHLIKIQEPEKISSKSLDGGLLEITVEIRALVELNDDEVLKTIMSDKDSLANATERYKNLQQEYEALKKQMEELKQSYRSAAPSQQNEIKKSIAQNNRYFEAFLALEEGNEYYFNHNFQSAILEYDRAIEVQPNFAEAYNNRGNANVMLKNYQQAVQDYQNAIKYNKVDARIYNNLGSTYFMLKDYHAAINEYGQALNLNPNLFDAYYNRALAYCYIGQYQAALSDARIAMNLKPSDPDAKSLYTQIAQKAQ